MAHGNVNVPGVTPAERATWNGKQNKISGTAGQVVVINAAGNAEAQNLNQLIKPQLLVSVDSGASVTATMGSHTQTKVATDAGVVFDLDAFGNWTVSATLNGRNSNTVQVNVDAVKSYTASLRFIRVYGAEWDGTSTPVWHRTDDAAGFTDPVPYVAGATSYGSPFDTLQPWAGMVKSERTGGTMVAIPRFWYKLTQNGNGIKVQIADRALPGFSVSPAHMDRGDGGGERGVIYVGRYHCATSDYKSKTGEVPKHTITRSAARTAIHNLGTNIWQSDFATRFTLWLLYIVEFANWDSQSKIGHGCGDNASAKAMGYTDSMPYHTGTTQSTRAAYGLGTQYRYIEGLWDNVCDWCDGCYNNASGLNIILNPNNFHDSTGGTLVGKPCSDFPSKFTVSEEAGYPLFFGSAGGGSETTYSCDGWYYSSSNRCLRVGGLYGQGPVCGLFCVVCDSTSSAGDYIGCRLLELP